MLREIIIQALAVYFTWVAVAVLGVALLWAAFNEGEPKTFPPGYSVVDEACTIVEQHWWEEEEGQPCP